MVFSRRDIISIIIKVVLIEAIVEILAIGTLSYFHLYNHHSLSIYLDPILSVLFAVPLIIVFVVRPYLKTKNSNANLIDQYENLIKKMNKSALMKEERYTLAEKSSNDGLWDWDLESEKIYFSKRWCQMVGVKEDEATDDKDLWLKRVHPQDLEKLLYYIDESIQSGCEKKYQCEYRLLNKKNRYFWAISKWMPFIDQTGKVIRIVGVQSNIEKNKKIEKQLIHDSMHDFLTKLPNRNLLNDKLHQALIRFKRSVSEDFALVLLDLDNFKYINDSLGHAVGDKLLIHIGKSLANLMKSEDTIARLGGDEFATIIHKPVDRHSFNEIMSKIANTLSSVVNIEGCVINASVSMGVVWCNKNTPYNSSDEIFKNADIALYHAKKLGKGRFAFYDNDLKEDIKQRFTVSNDLISALGKKQFTIVYQPIVLTKDGQLAGFEALLRWNHPELGLVPPELFIPVAEESNIIADLGNFVIQQSCKELGMLIESQAVAKNWFICVNVSARQLESNDIIFEVERAIHDNGLNYHNLKLEVTESTLLKNVVTGLLILEELRKKGIEIAIDDFGIGYSSLSMLYHFSFSLLKIDKSFITNMLTQSRLKSMVESIILMAKALDLKVVVEGIENEEQYLTLKEMGVEYIQGYYFGQPLSLVELQISVGEGFYPLNWSTNKYVNRQF